MTIFLFGLGVFLVLLALYFAVLAIRFPEDSIGSNITRLLAASAAGVGGALLIHANWVFA